MLKVNLTFPSQEVRHNKADDIFILFFQCFFRCFCAQLNYLDRNCRSIGCSVRCSMGQFACMREIITSEKIICRNL